MGTSEISDEFSDWEEIRYDYQPPLSTSDPQNLEFRLELKENFYSDELSVFPPSEHEGLPLLPADSKSSEEETLSVSSLSVAVSETDCARQHQIVPDSKVSVVLRDVGVGISTFWGRMFSILVTNLQCQSRSLRRGSIFIPGAAFAVALLAFLKILQWKNRLMHLIREKDKRISQLLSQIAYMNDILSARRKVPILRIN